MTALYPDQITNVASNDDASYQVGDTGTNRGVDFLATLLNSHGTALNELKTVLGTTGVVGAYATVEARESAIEAAITALGTSKANASHTHPESDISGLVATLNTLGSGYIGAFATLAARLADFDVRLQTLQGPPPITPGIYLDDAQITTAATNLIAGTDPQAVTYNSTDGTNGGMNPGSAGLNATNTTGTWPTAYVANTSSNARASQRGTFHNSSLTSDIRPSDYPATADADATPKAVATLRIPTSTYAQSIAYYINAHGAGVDPNDGSTIYPSGDIELTDDARTAFACAYTAAVLKKASTLTGGTAWNASAAAWASALATQSARFLNAWATTNTAIRYDSVRSATSGGSGYTGYFTSVPLSKTAGTRIYDNTKLVVAWATQDFTRAASLLQTYFAAEWAAVNASGQGAFATWLNSVIYPHLAGTGGAGDSTTRGWTNSQNWNAVIADSMIAIGIYLGSITIRNFGLQYARDMFPAAVYMTGDQGLLPWGISTTCPAPQGTTSNNAHGTAPDSGNNTVAQLLSRWTENAGDSSNTADGNHLRATPTLLTFSIDGMNQETVRDISHVMLGLGSWAALCESMWHQSVDFYDEVSDRLIATFEFHARATYEYLTGGGHFWNGASGATGIETSANWSPTIWPVTPSNTWASSATSNTHNMSFKVGGAGYKSGWHIFLNHFKNRVGLAYATSSDPIYWTNLLLTSTTASGLSGNPLVKDIFTPSSPSAGVLGESMSHGNISA